MKKLFTFPLLFLSLLGFSQSTFYPIESPSNRNFECIQFIDNTTGYIAGDSVLIKSEDGGASWSEIDLNNLNINNNSNYLISDMHWQSASSGWIVLSNWSGLHSTNDGGETWSELTPMNDGFCQKVALEFKEDGTAFLGGAGCFTGALIDYYIDGTWYSANLPENWDTEDLVTCIRFFGNDLGFAGTSKGSVLKTTDGGVNWTNVYSNGELSISDFVSLDGEEIRLTFFTDDSNFGIMKSLDAGDNWEIDGDLATFYYPDMHAAYASAEGQQYFAGSNGKDPNSGVIFEYPEINFMDINKPIKDINGYGEVVFLVGDDGSIFVNDIDISNNLESIDGNAFFEIYPNPTSGTIQLTSDVNWDYLELINSSGAVVLTQTKQSFSQVKNATLELSTLSPGAYQVILYRGHTALSKRIIKI
ncbi:MAG: YCF48-related protein [Flavobacteriales bacterium]|nr:YCF48-related protein [Flavobacteriales bacterium]